MEVMDALVSYTKRMADLEELCRNLSEVTIKLGEVAQWYIDNDCEMPAANPQRLASAKAIVSEAAARIEEMAVTLRRETEAISND